MKYVIYTRVSDEKEGSISHEMQVKECMKRVGNNKFLVFSESNVSGDSEKRPVLDLAIDSLSKGDELLVWKMDRLSRDLWKAGPIISKIKMKKAEIHSYCEPNFFENGDGETLMVLSLLFANRELQNIRMRIKTALRTKKEAGYRVGHIPYGYTIDENNMIISCADELSAVEEMHRLYYTTGLTLREVAIELNKKGLQNRGGSPWTHYSVRRILKNRDSHAQLYQAKSLAPH